MWWWLCAQLPVLVSQFFTAYARAHVVVRVLDRPPGLTRARVARDRCVVRPRPARSSRIVGAQIALARALVDDAGVLAHEEQVVAHAAVVPLACILEVVPAEPVHHRVLLETNFESVGRNTASELDDRDGGVAASSGSHQGGAHLGISNSGGVHVADTAADREKSKHCTKSKAAEERLL